MFNLLLNKLIVFNILKFCLELELDLVCDFWVIFLFDVELFVDFVDILKLKIIYIVL